MRACAIAPALLVLAFIGLSWVELLNIGCDTEAWISFYRFEIVDVMLNEEVRPDPIVLERLGGTLDFIRHISGVEDFCPVATRCAGEPGCRARLRLVPRSA